MKPFIIGVDGEPTACLAALGDGKLSLEIHLAGGEPTKFEVDIEVLAAPGKKARRKKKPAPVVKTKAGSGRRPDDEVRGSSRVPASSLGSSPKASPPKTAPKPP